VNSLLFELAWDVIIHQELEGEGVLAWRDEASCEVSNWYFQTEEGCGALELVDFNGKAQGPVYVHGLECNSFLEHTFL